MFKMHGYAGRRLAAAFLIGMIYSSLIFQAFVALADEDTVRSIKVDVDCQNLAPGEEGHVKASFDPEDEQTPEVVWSSSDSGLIQITDDGKITVPDSAVIPQSGADVDIWAKTTDGSLLMDCATVTVLPMIRSLTLLNDSIVLKANEDAFAAVAVAIEPDHLAGMVKIVWTSSDESVARVDAAGNGETALVYSGKCGSAVITASARDGSQCTDSLTVTVE